MDELYFILMTHLCWIKAYSFTLDCAFSFPKKPDIMLNDLPACCTFPVPGGTIVPVFWLNLDATESADLFRQHLRIKRTQARKSVCVFKK